MFHGLKGTKTDPGYVVLSGIFESDLFVSECFEKILGMGIDDPVLYGGYFRNTYLGIPPLDHDFQSGFGPYMPTPDNVDQVREKIQSMLKQMEGVSELECIMAEYDGPHKRSDIAFEFLYKGKAVALHLSTDPDSAIQVAQGTDAPLNSVAMDKNGVVFAHPEFCNHADQLKYAPFPRVPQQRQDERFIHLQRQIPGLQFVRPSPINQRQPPLGVKPAVSS